jgi:outer membrane protein assembly factor BamD (BamD/ComL family)
MRNLAKIDELGQSRIVFDFSDLPEVQLKTSGQRVDLLFSDTEVASSLPVLPEDDKIVKILLARKPKELLVSILLHKIPASVSTIKSPATRQITLAIDWPTVGAKRPAIAFHLSGMPAAHKSLKGISTPQSTSAYSGRWQDFFKTFHAPLDIPVPIRHTFPALPSLSLEKADKPGQTLLQLANAGKWQALLKQVKTGPSFAAPDMAAVLHAEALLRTGHPDSALAVLDTQRSVLEAAPQANRAAYLRALAEARSGESYQARCSLLPLLEKQHAASALAPFGRLLEAELLLSIGKPAQAFEILKEPVQNWPTALQRPVQWRRAEALVMIGKAAEAERGFRRLFSRPDHFAKLPEIRYHAALACLNSGRYRQAEGYFRALAGDLHNPVDHGNSLFYAARAAYLDNDLKSAMVTLEQLRDNYEGTEPGFRAWLALLDHRFLNQGSSSFAKISSDYGTIARKAPLRVLREEAAFKQALAVYLHNRQERAANLLQVFLRNFSHGPLRGEARALLSELLPPLIQNLIDNGHDMKAVVMVDQNRALLINGNLAWPFLPDLAKAYTRLGLWDKASKSYYFLIDSGAKSQRDKPYYLPLAQLLYDRTQYAMAVSVAQRYREKYPSGTDREKLFELQLAALEKSNRLEEAAVLLKQPKHPQSDGIALQSARIHWKRDDMAEIIAQPKGLNSDAEGLLLRAEALFRASRNIEALVLYEQLQQQEEYADQATYRCGQIKLKTGNTQSALKLLSQLTENKPASFWGRLAKDAIDAHNMN